MLSIKQAILRQEKLLGETYAPPYCMSALNQRFQPGNHCLNSLLHKMYGRAGNWEMPDNDTVILTRVITSHGAYAFGAKVRVILHRNGKVDFFCDVTNGSSVSSYNYRIAVLITTLSGQVLMFRKSGEIDHEGDDQFNEFTFSEVVAEFFEEFINSWIDTVTDYSDSIINTIEDGFQLIFSWILGLTLIPDQFIGCIVFLGVELYSLVSTGSFETGARIINGTLWMMGPFGTFYAIAAGIIVQLGVNHQQLSKDVYDWANDLIFHNSLPPIDTIYLTDLIGEHHRAFTFPMYALHKIITINMGPNGFTDPRKYRMGQRNPATGRIFKYGEMIIHELVHAWQIAHSSLSQVFLARAFANVICETTGGNPYLYMVPPERPFEHYNLEQEACIVSDWYNLYFMGNESDNRKMDMVNGVKDPRYKYIRDVIQTAF